MISMVNYNKKKPRASGEWASAVVHVRLPECGNAVTGRTSLHLGVLLLCLLGVNHQGHESLDLLHRYLLCELHRENTHR